MNSSEGLNIADICLVWTDSYYWAILEVKIMDVENPSCVESGYLECDAGVFGVPWPR
jgi:hypothetical protein